MAASLFLIMLRELGKLPDWATVISTALWAVALGFSALSALLAAVLPKGLWKQTKAMPRQSKVRYAIISGIAVALAIAIPYAVPSASPAESIPASGATVPSPPTYAWKPLLVQAAPNCHNPARVEWYVHGITRYSCTNAGTIMQQTSPHYYGEMDLVKVHGGIYSQTTFRVQVQVTFQNPADPTTWAALLVQTPAPINVVGGYIFVLSPTGQCQLQQVVSAQEIPVVDRGTVTNLDLHQSATMAVIVQNGVLYASVNGQPVISHPDNLDASPRQVGLIVERENAALSSPVDFSQFELDG